MKYKLLHKPCFHATNSLNETLIKANDSLMHFKMMQQMRANNLFCGHDSNLESHLDCKELCNANEATIDGI